MKLEKRLEEHSALIKCEAIQTPPFPDKIVLFSASINECHQNEF